MSSLFSFLKSSDGFKKEYDMNPKVLGQGKFAKVYRATHKATGQAYAIKVIQKDACLKAGELVKTQDEIEIMKKVKHPNCIAFHDMYDSKEKLYIVMELVTGGELFDRIIDAGHFSETEAAKCFKQIIQAVGYLHSIGIVHRDIKPENILYMSTDPDSPVKLVDFGLGKIIDIHGSQRAHMMTVCGTPSYLAPEVIQRTGYGKECDIWSCGVILYILLSGCPPFDQGKAPRLLFQDIMNANYSFPPDYWKLVSQEAQDLVRKMMVVNIQSRMTPDQVLDHPWMRRYNAGDLSKENIEGVQKRLRDWQATRRLKAAINTFVALLRMSSAMLSELPDEATQEKILQKVRADPARMEVLEASFATLDRDKSGVLDVQNIADSMKALGVAKSQGELNEMVQRFDVKKTGHITFEEFCIMMGPAYYDQSSPGNQSAQKQKWEFELQSIFQVMVSHR